MLMWMHTFTHAIHYDWFIKTDTDTYVFVTNLRIYLKQYKPFEDLYLGHTVEHNGGTHHYASGGLYMISQSTLQKLGLILDTPKCQKKQGGIEDVRFASCMMNLGILPQTILDSRGRETIMLLPLKDHLSLDPKSSKQRKQHEWYFNRISQTNFRADCCSFSPIAFHEIKNSSEFRSIYHLVMDNTNNTQLSNRLVESYIRSVA